jgi:hypothetical protein
MESKKANEALINDNEYVDYDRSLLNAYRNSMFEFAGIFSSNAMRILLGEIDLLKTQYSRLDIFSVAQLNNQNLRLLRNTIYARHGCIFNLEDLTVHFKQFDWYNPRFENVDRLLTDVDKYNIQMIQEFESRNKKLPVITYNIVGFWHDNPSVGAGYGEHFIIYPDNRLEFYFSSMRDLSIVGRLNGSYTVNGNVLIFFVEEISFATNDSEYEAYTWGYGWANEVGNKMTFEKPIIYEFPVSTIETMSWDSGYTLETIKIGGQNFFKFSDDVNFGR